MAHGVITALFYLMVSTLLKNSDVENPAWVCLNYAALAQASTGVAKL